MPVSANTGKAGGQKRVFRTTDKCVQAEMKNKVETARLHLYKRILDRQQCHNKFMVEKGKRSSLRSLGLMRKTSGLSTHGEPPEGPQDRSHETSPYFKSYRPLTEKRLLQWRVKEEMLQRQLGAEEEIIPPWERDPNEDIGENFGKTMRMLGFNVEDDDFIRKKQGEKPVKRTGEYVLTSELREPVDVFECLRADIEGETDKKSKGRSFPVAVWGERMKQGYIRLVSDQKTTGMKTRVQSAQARMQTDEHGSETPNINGVKQEPRTPRIRPHTASVHSRAMKTVVVNDRPSSALGTIHANSTNSRSISRSESQGSANISELDLSENDDVFNEADTSNGNYTTGESHVNAPKSVALTNGHLNSSSTEDNANDRETVCTAAPTKSGSLRRTVSMPEKQLNGSTPKVTLSRKKSNLVNDSITSSAIESKLSKRDSQFLLSSVLPGQGRKGKVTFSLGETDTSNYEENGANGLKKKVKSMDQLVKINKSSKRSDLQLDERELEKMSGLGKRAEEDIDDLFAKMPTNRDQQKRQNVLLNKTEKRIAHHAASRQMTEKAISSADALDDFMDSDDSEDGEEANSDFRRMPQWKRELMAEAPPGLFGPKSAAKVVIAMSKAQRRRELDHLVQENISDVKKLTDKEHARRIRARLHMYFTMRKLKDSVSEISGRE